MIDFWSPIAPMIVGELVTVDHTEEFFCGTSPRLVNPGDVLIITRISEDGIISRVLLGELELAPHPIDHPTFVRIAGTVL